MRRESRAGHQGHAARKGFRPPRLHVDRARRERGAGGVASGVGARRSRPTPTGSTPPTSRSRPPTGDAARLPRDAGQRRAVPGRAGRSRDLRPQPLHEGRLPAPGEGRLLRDRARPVRAQGGPDEDHRDGRDHADREHASTTPSSSPTTTRPSNSRARAARRDLARMAITGFCRGGRTTLVYAAANPQAQGRGRVVRSASAGRNEYTPRTAMDRVAEIKVPVLGLYGAKDAGIPVDQVEKFFAALKAAGHAGRARRVPRRRHGFHARISARQLPQGRRRGRLEADARVVREVRRGLTSPRFPGRHGRLRPPDQLASRSLLRPGTPAQQVELVVGPHAGEPAIRFDSAKNAAMAPMSQASSSVRAVRRERREVVVVDRAAVRARP